MDSPTPALNALVIITVLLGVLVIASRIRSLRRVGAFHGITNDADWDPGSGKGAPLNRFERSLMLGIYAGILGVLVLTLKTFVGMTMGVPAPVGWRSYAPTLVVSLMVIAQGALLWRAAKTHLPRILSPGEPDSVTPAGKS
jgi:hypothetical protein